MRIFASIGRHSAEVVRELRDSMAVLGESAAEAAALPFHPRRFRFRDSMLAFERASFDSLPVSCGVGFLLGLILAFQSAAALRAWPTTVLVR